MSTTIPRAEIDAVTDRHGDSGFFGDNDMTVQQIRECTAYLHYSSVDVHVRAMAADLDALADRYEPKAKA